MKNGRLLIWNKAFREKAFRSSFILTITTLVILLIGLTKFLEFVEARLGITLDDPILKLFSPVDVTWLTFILIYMALITALFVLSSEPERLLCAVQAYILMIFFRIIAMYLLPLNPPEQMILLQDPIIEFVKSGVPYTKDLFFSGHTATMFLIFLTADTGKLKTFFLFLTILVAACVLIQHVHYSIDVFAAPFFTLAAFKISRRINNR